MLGLICLATAAALYLEPIAEIVGRRALVVQIHVWSGLALPVPVLLGLASRAVRSDYRLLNRWTRVDREWLRRRDRRTAGLPVGKFNAGQKLNASLSAGGGLVLLGTGIVLEYGRRWPLDLRIGATFVHDWAAFAVLLLVVGHVWFAGHDQDALRGIRTGRVPVVWALREHPAWAGGLLTGCRRSRRGRNAAWIRTRRGCGTGRTNCCPRSGSPAATIPRRRRRRSSPTPTSASTTRRRRRTPCSSAARPRRRPIRRTDPDRC